MKKIIVLWLSAFLVFGVNAQTTGTNAEANTQIENFKTYDWISSIDNIPKDKVFVGPNGILVFNNESARKKIKEAIEYELDARGYRKQNGNVDMLISFTVLEQPASLRTTHGFVELTTGEQVLTDENVSYTDVEPGTLIVNVINANTNQMVWQGFTSGILKPNEINDQSKVRQAVSSIFERFRHRVTGSQQ